MVGVWQHHFLQPELRSKGHGMQSKEESWTQVDHANAYLVWLFVLRYILHGLCPDWRALLPEICGIEK